MSKDKPQQKVKMHVPHTKGVETKMRPEVAAEIIALGAMGVVPEMAVAPLKGIDLYRALAKAGFPQGGQGSWFKDPNSDEKYYIPKPEEIYAQFVADPSGWEKLVDALARVWIENKV